MDANTSVRVEHVSKKFCKNIRKSMTYGMKDIARNTVGLSSHSDILRDGEFWAVDDVSFEVQRGEALGIIGANGSGKSTVLRLLNGIFWPDKGKVSIRGKVGALIEVGAGFHPMLTGMENIYVNAAILGMNRREVDARIDEIVDFADIGDFIHSPVKYYSSGMFVRLGFSVAIHSNPDVLLVDEVLAVGDRAFVMKCYQKMHDVKKRGTTVLLVSHNIYTIKEQTKKCLYLCKGQERFLGETEDAINLYLRDMYESRSIAPVAGSEPARGLSKEAKLESLRFEDAHGREVSYLESGEKLVIVLSCLIRRRMHNPVFGVNFYGDEGFMYCANSHYEGISFGDVPAGNVEIKITIPNLHLPCSSYRCSVVIAEESPDNLIDWHDMTYTLVIGRAKNSRGSLKLPTEWQVSRCKSDEFILRGKEAT